MTISGAGTQPDASGPNNVPPVVTADPGRETLYTLVFHGGNKSIVAGGNDTPSPADHVEGSSGSNTEVFKGGGERLTCRIFSLVALLSALPVVATAV